MNLLGKGKGWTLAVWDSRTGKLTMVADSPVGKDGRPLYGGEVVPVLTRNYLYWIQAAPEVHHLTGTGVGSELMQYSFASGKTRVLYDGLVDAFVPYGKNVLFTAPRPGARASKPGYPPPLVVRAVNQQTGKSVSAPKGLNAGHDNPSAMVTNGDLIVWSAVPSGAIRAWRPEWGKTVTVSRGGQDSLGLWGHYLVFRSFADKNTVLDLYTDSLTTLTPHNGFPDLGGSYLGLWQATSSAPSGASYVSYLLDLAKLPDLPGCPSG